MKSEHDRKKVGIDRRQFIIKSALGVCGLSAAYGTYNVVLSSTEYLSRPFQNHHYEKPAIPPFNEDAHFFNPHQYATVATIAALIIPTDDEPGATEARVVDHIDKITAGSEKKQKIYTKGLNSLDSFSQDKYGNTFFNLIPATQMEIMSVAYDVLPGSSFPHRVGRRLIDIWRGIAGTRRRFFREIYSDVVEGFYANPVAWQQVGYFGPPNPVGYPDFTEPPSAKHYARTVRLVDNVSCNTCHEIGEHPRGGLIDHTCTACHRPHSPWPYDQSSFYLEDHIGAVFSNPDRESLRSRD